MPRRKSYKDDNRAKEPRVDRRIRVPEVLVIDSNGEKLGVLPTGEALRRAQEQHLNLVEVAPNVRPPVCKILDYGRYKYDQKQDAKRKKKHQVTIEVKEVKFRPKVDKHDFDFKVRHCERFLAEGNRVKCTIMFRGREMAHPNLGEDVLKRVLAVFEGKIIVDSPPRLEGRNMSMQIAPKPGAWKKPEKPVEEAPRKGAHKLTRAEKAARGQDEDEPDEAAESEGNSHEPELSDEADAQTDDGGVTASV